MLSFSSLRKDQIQRFASLIPMLISSLFIVSYHYCYQYYFQNNKIHIVSLIEGDKDFNYINVLIKSILYHQKRFHCQNNKCCLGDLCKRSKTGNFPCSYKKILKTDCSITFHFITDKPTRLKFQKMEQSWQLINVKFQFYEYQHYLVCSFVIIILFFCLCTSYTTWWSVLKDTSRTTQMITITRFLSL